MKCNKIVMCMILIIIMTVEYPVIAYDRGEAYGMGIAGIVSGDVLLSLLVSVGFCSGIYNSSKATAESFKDLPDAERSEYLNSIAVSDKALYKMIYDEGYFDGTGLEDIVYAAVYGEDGTSALDRYLESTGSKDDVNVIGGNAAADADGNIKMGIGASVDFLSRTAKKVAGVVSKWIKDKGQTLANSGATFPDKLPNGTGSTEIHYIMYAAAGATAYYAVTYEYRNHKGYGEIFNDYGCYHLLCNQGTVYKWDGDEWILDYFYREGSNHYAYPDMIVPFTDALDIYYTDLPIHLGEKEVSGKKEFTGSGAGTAELTPEQACDRVNEYLDSLGISTRCRLVDESDASAKPIYGNLATEVGAEGDKTDKLVLSPDIATNYENVLAPVGEAVRDNTAAGIQDIAAEGNKENVKAVAPSLSITDIAGLTSVPQSESLGSMSKYKFFGLEEKFPFCIPFDLIDFFSVLDAEPEAPSFTWTIPLHVVGLEDASFEVDLSALDSVAKIIRTMELLGGIVGLIMLTRNIIRG